MKSLINSKISQSAIEFVILVGFVLFFFVSFLAIIQESTSDRVRENKDIIIKQTALAVQDEIIMARKTSNGYLREFSIPDKIAGEDYDITLVNEMVYIKTKSGKNAIALPLPKVNGEIAKGKNIIRKENNEVYLNS